MNWGPLRERPFRLLFWGQTVSTLGDQLVLVALSLAMLELGFGATEIGLVNAMYFPPLILLTLLGGAWADRYSRRNIMIAMDLVRLASQGLLAALVATGRAHLWPIVLLNAVRGGASAIFGPAVSALVPRVVSPNRL